MRKVMIFIMLLIPSHAFGWSTPEEYCSELSSSFEAMADQFPIQLDRETSYTGGSAKFVNNRCHISFNYLLDQDVFIEAIQYGAKVGGGVVPSKDRVILDLNAEHGREVFSQSMTAVGGPDIHGIAKKKFTSTSMNFEFDLGDIAPITVLVEDYISKYDDNFDLCYVIEEAKDELMGNAPMQIDPYTKFLFGSVEHIKTGCIVEFKYEIDEDSFIESEIEEVLKITHGTIKPTKQEFIEFLNSEESQEFLETTFSSAIDSFMKTIGKLPFIDITIQFLFDKGNINPVTIKLG